MRWGHAEALSESVRFPALRLEPSLWAPLAQHYVVAARLEYCVKRSDELVR